MNTPNNAAALECVLDEMGAFIEQEESPNLDTLENWHQRLRATLAQPDALTNQLDVDALAQEIRRVDGGHSLGAGALAEALAPYIAAFTSQPSGEAVGFVTSDGFPALHQRGVPPPGSSLYANPSADAPVVAVDWLSTADFMKAVSIELMLTFADDSASAGKAYMAISKVTAALAPKPEGWEPCSPELPRIPYPKPEGGQ